MMRCLTRCILLAGAFLVATLSALPAQDVSDIDSLLERGMHLHRAGDLLGAIQNYQVALESAPERADIRSNLGAAYVALGKFTEGIDQYRRALATRDDATVRLNLALALYKSGRVADAQPEFERVMQQDPGNRQGTLLLADCLLQLGREKDVVALLSPREAEFGEDDLAFAYLLGTALVLTDNTERGQVLIDRIFKKGDSAEGHLMLGSAYMSKKDYLNAVKELARAIQINPDLPLVHAAYGRALLNTGDRANAIPAFRRELQLNPNNFDANLQLGNLYRLEQRHADALMYLKRAEAAQSTHPAVRHGLAAAYLALNEPEKARELLEAAIQETPSFIDAHVLLATTYYRLRRKEDGDREREVVERLTAEAQARQPGARAADVTAPAADAAVPPQTAAPPQRR
jgi:Tfp pilus assembly protein PilF